MKRVRILFLILLGISIFVTTEFALNFFANYNPVTNDGIVLKGILPRVVFGDSGWTMSGFFSAFSITMWIMVIVAISNIVIHIVETSNRH